MHHSNSYDCSVSYAADEINTDMSGKGGKIFHLLSTFHVTYCDITYCKHGASLYVETEYIRV